MDKLKSVLWYLVLRLLILFKDVAFLLKAISFVLLFWYYEQDDLDAETHEMDVIDRKWTRFGR